MVILHAFIYMFIYQYQKSIVQQYSTKIHCYNNTKNLQELTPPAQSSLQVSHSVFLNSLSQ